MAGRCRCRYLRREGVGVRRKVPRVDLKEADLDDLDVLDARRRLVLALRRRVKLARGGLVSMAQNCWMMRCDGRIKLAFALGTEAHGGGLRYMRMETLYAHPLV